MSRVVDAAGHAGERLDRFLAATVDLSRARLQQLIDEGHVTVNGRPARASLRLRGTERVEVTVPPPVSTALLAEALPLTVLHEDRDVVVVDKAPGMVVHPGAGHRSGTLVNALLHHVGDLEGVGGELRPGIVHRLDRDTSGVLVIAKHQAALATLQDAFRSRVVHKTYLALVYGHPPAAGTWDTLYGRHPTHRTRFSSRVTAGKRAVTRYVATERLEGATLLTVELETGRTHQIRVHAADAGFPLLGDEVYGSRASRSVKVIARQALHALELAFPHPRTGKTVTVSAPVPRDLAAAVAALRRARAGARRR